MQLYDPTAACFWPIDQHILFDNCPGLLHLFSVGDEHPARSAWHLPGGHQLGDHGRDADISVLSARLDQAPGYLAIEVKGLRASLAAFPISALRTALLTCHDTPS